MNFTSEINIIKNLVREYWTEVGGIEGNRIQHYGEIAVSKLQEHNFNLSDDEREILAEVIDRSDIPLTRVSSLVHHPLE